MSDYLDIHMITRQLTDWYTHREPYTHEQNGTTWQGHHITQVPPLITQLLKAKPAATKDMSGAGPCSRPAANIDALDTYAHIDKYASRWVRDLGEDDPIDTIACIRKVHALAANAHHCGNAKATTEERTDPKTGTKRRKVVCCTVHQIERDIRSWWTQARISSGWDIAAWAPNNTCPACTKRRTLRIRPDDRTGMCTNCRATWDSTNIGILAEHVRQENNDTLGEAAS